MNIKEDDRKWMYLLNILYDLIHNQKITEQTKDDLDKLTAYANAIYKGE